MENIYKYEKKNRLHIIYIHKHLTIVYKQTQSIPMQIIEYPEDVLLRQQQMMFFCANTRRRWETTFLPATMPRTQARKTLHYHELVPVRHEFESTAKLIYGAITY